MKETKSQSDEMLLGRPKGRGAGYNPGNRFETRRLEVLEEQLDELMAYDSYIGNKQVKTHVYRDHSKTIINRVDSPDIPFSWTMNPYRGCEHGCVYCYARPTHEYLGMSSGVDFESKIFAKLDAAKLMRKELGRKGWKGEPISMSGITDCYQPVESRLKLMEACLYVAYECRQPVGIVTKNRLVLRDLEMLRALHSHRCVHVAVSVTTLDNDLSWRMEPRASAPRDRLWTIERLRSAGVPVMAMIAPVIPGLNDHELPRMLEAVAKAGAVTAGYVLLRLPYQNKGIFEDWLEEHYPERKEKVLSLMRQCRDGKLYDAAMGTRMRGTGPVANQIGRMFQVFKKKYGLDRRMPQYSVDKFRRPMDTDQLELFG